MDIGNSATLANCIMVADNINLGRGWWDKLAAGCTCSDKAAGTSGSAAADSIVGWAHWADMRWAYWVDMGWAYSVGMDWPFIG